MSGPAADLAHADIGIVCALPIELASFVGRCGHVRKYTGGAFTFRGGKYDQIRVAIVEAGMGAARAAQATQALIDAHSPTWVVSAGFSGGLQPAVKVGHLVVGTSIEAADGSELAIDMKMPADPERGLHVGKLVNTPQLVRTIEEKQALAARTGALAVDLETAAVAQTCRAARRPFLAVRVISDDLSADLPPEILTVVGNTGSVRLGATLGALWKRPQAFNDLLVLRENAHACSERLADFLDGVVRQLYAEKH